MKKKSYVLSFIACLLAVSNISGSRPTSNDRINIDGSQTGDTIPSSLYGVFFEEISHSGDGGLYAEMIQNRGFEDGNLPSGTTLKNGHACAPALPCYSNDSINRFKVRWPEGKALDGWTVKAGRNATAKYDITTNAPLHPATPHSLHLPLGVNDSPVTVINHGYWNMALEKSKKYTLTLWVKSSPKTTPFFCASLKNGQGETACRQTVALKNDGQWNCYQTTLTANRTGNDFRLFLDFDNQGDIFLDYVSLFPEDTFRKRPNGLRNDIATYLADLRPAFIRWPGGCIVEGLTLENGIRWKETIGNPMTRPGEYNLWGYRSTYGFGYHEFLQYCEDIRTDAMFVCNAGMSCLFRNGDYAEGEELDRYIQDALDAIEYAIGDTSTVWGRQRAANGHPDPFPLKYVEVGNENVGSRYASHYRKFYQAIKKKYPQITVICALMFHPEVAEAGEMEFIDPHYYETADWFYRNGDLYDSIPALFTSKIYIGEYAATGTPCLYSSLAEAAFLTGVERNSSRVQLVSYAPLFQNANQGKGHLIIFKNDSVYGRTNYHILKMFAENRPDYNIHTRLIPGSLPEPLQPQGMIGLGSCGSMVAYKDFKIEKEEQTVYETDDFSDLSENWKATNGKWETVNGTLLQSRLDRDGYIWLNDRRFGDCTISLKAKKLKGREAFRIFFGAKGESDFFMADLGSHQNESVIFGERRNGTTTSLFDYRNTTNIRAGEWYDIKVEIKGNHWKCYLNGELAYEYTYKPLTRHYAISGYDAQKQELVIKLVNGENREWMPDIHLSNLKNIQPKAQRITLSAKQPDAENSFASPNLVTPQNGTVEDVKEDFTLTCPANSFTILRISCNRQ